MPTVLRSTYRLVEYFEIFQTLYLQTFPYSLQIFAVHFKEKINDVPLSLPTINS